ncbi:YkvA family protein [Pseudoalteromonas fenneropenaei]|uniref:YkvA family protein n=1 Tax=Pseudoalteromonas fenneropenaei TaxID=1737459 RepID=A0ABV7CI85_9GAMM
MSLEINLELTDADLAHFRQLMDAAIAKCERLSDDEIITRARALVSKMENATLPEFVQCRLLSLNALIDAVQDDEWQMPEDEKKEIMTSLAYFSEPEDIVPDNVPVLGYLDDAIMIELVLQNLSLDLKAYREFCGFRATEESRRGEAASVNRESWLAGTRAQIRASMRRSRGSHKRVSFLSRIM